MFRRRKAFWTSLFIICILVLLGALLIWFPESRERSERTVAISDLRILGQAAIILIAELPDSESEASLEEVLQRVGYNRENRIRGRIAQGDLILVQPLPPIEERNIIAILRFEEEIFIYEVSTETSGRIREYRK